MPRSARYRLARPVRAVVERAILRLSGKYVVDGVRVFIDDDRPGGRHEDLLATLEDALVLLSELRPRTARFIASRLRGILVKRELPSQYWPSSRVCVLDRAAMELSPAYVATALLGEATRARLWRGAAWLPSRGQADRIEVACRRAQIAFLDRLPRETWPSTDDAITYLRGRMAEIAAPAVRERSR